MHPAMGKEGHQRMLYDVSVATMDALHSQGEADDSAGQIPTSLSAHPTPSAIPSLLCLTFSIIKGEAGDKSGHLVYKR